MINLICRNLISRLIQWGNKLSEVYNIHQWSATYICTLEWILEETDITHRFMKWKDHLVGILDQNDPRCQLKSKTYSFLIGESRGRKLGEENPGRFVSGKIRGLLASSKGSTPASSSSNLFCFVPDVLFIRVHTDTQQFPHVRVYFQVQTAAYISFESEEFAVPFYPSVPERDADAFLSYYLSKLLNTPRQSGTFKFQ